jgi:superfamily II DNA/RNA helicase
MSLVRAASLAKAAYSEVTNTFRDLGVTQALANKRKVKGMTQPSPVRLTILPDVLPSHDILSRGKTDSGKLSLLGSPYLQTSVEKQLRHRNH